VKSQNWTPRTKEKKIGSGHRMLWGVEIEARVPLKVAWARENVALGNQIRAFEYHFYGDKLWSACEIATRGARRRNQS
jgi:hypothetical protein